jgi:hypothetical protein
LSRVGQVFGGRNWFAVVTEGPGATRRRGSTLPPDAEPLDPDCPVYTLAVWGDSGAVHWPVERREGSLDRWEGEGKLLASP